MCHVPHNVRNMVAISNSIRSQFRVVYVLHGTYPQESDTAMSSQRNTGAFILGGVVGGLIGATVTLWNTPKSGDELRALISGGSSPSPGPADTTDGVSSTRSTTSGRFSNPVLSFIEKAAAPLVGVELGKLAKDDPESAQYQPVRASAADARPPTHGDEHVPHVDDQHAASVDELTSPPPPATRTVRSESVSDDRPSLHGDEHISHDEVDFDNQHAATVEELTSPPPVTNDTGGDREEANKNREPSPFPDLEHNDRT